MINGGIGRRLTIFGALILVILLVCRAMLLVYHQNDAASSLNETVSLLIGGLLGAVGVNPGSKDK